VGCRPDRAWGGQEAEDARRYTRSVPCSSELDVQSKLTAMSKQDGSAGLVIALDGKGGVRSGRGWKCDWRDASEGRKGGWQALTPEHKTSVGALVMRQIQHTADLVFGEEVLAAMLR